eukprot:gene12015-biopygen5980
MPQKMYPNAANPGGWFPNVTPPRGASSKANTPRGSLEEVFRLEETSGKPEERRGTARFFEEASRNSAKRRGSLEEASRSLEEGSRSLEKPRGASRKARGASRSLEEDIQSSNNTNTQ